MSIRLFLLASCLVTMSSLANAQNTKAEVKAEKTAEFKSTATPAVKAEKITQTRKVLKFTTNHEGYPPYIIANAKKEYSGIMYDVLASYCKKNTLKLEMVDLPTKRVDEILKKGDEADLGAKAKEWTSKPEDYIWTETIVDAKDVIFYKNDPKNKDITKAEDLFKKTIAVRLGYKYPEMDKYFTDKQIIREDSQDEFSLLNKTKLGRVDGSLINEVVGLWVLKQNNMQGSMKVSTFTAGLAGYRFRISKKDEVFAKDLANKINEHLVDMKKSGEFDKILTQYK